MRTTRYILLLLLAGLASANAFLGDLNQNGQLLKWALVNLHPQVSTNVVNPVTRAVRYFIATDAYSTNKTAEYNSVRASFAQLQAVPGTHLKFEDAGLSPTGMDINTEDGTNIVYWAKTSTIVNGGTDNIGGLLGVCYFSFYDDNSMSGGDVVLNAVERTWTADYNAPPGGGAIFIESVLTHELGHFIGLSHSPAGGATLLAYGDVGLSSQAGLASDDVSGVQAIYPVATNVAALGHLRGTVTKNGNPVLGASVSLEDTSGRLIAATLSRANGAYEIPCVPAGPCLIRVCPLDPPINYWLVAGAEFGAEFANADLNFLPTTNHPVTLTAGATNQLNVTVAAAVPPFRITHLREPTANAAAYSISSLPITLLPGQSNLTIGVFSPDLPSSGLKLEITGSNITHGQLIAHAMDSVFSGLAGVSVRISIASNAVIGMRSLVVTRTNDGAKAWANGFVDIVSPVPDYNFDGLDDRFQRQYFPLFTAPEAGPTTDPDGDGFTNQAEYVAGTSPTNALSLLKLESLTQNQTGTTIRWKSVSGKRYQAFGRTQVAGSPWQALGSPVTAAGATAQYFDAGATGALKFYRVQVLP